MSGSSPICITGECAGPRLRQRFRIDGRGPAIVLVHGVGVCLEDQQRLADELCRDFRVLRYDLRGHGGSEKVPGPYTLTDFALDLLELTDALGIEQADCFGFSLGGLIVQRYALDHPERVRRLGLVSAIAGRSPAERAAALRRADALAGGGPGAHLGAAIDRWFTADFIRAHPDVVDARRARIAANHLPSYAAAYRVLAAYDLADEISAIRHPTLVVTGEHDEGSHPGMARLMAERIAGAELHILPGLKHALALEAPALLGGLMRDFLRRP